MATTAVSTNAFILGSSSTSDLAQLALASSLPTRKTKNQLTSSASSSSLLNKNPKSKVKFKKKKNTKKKRKKLRDKKRTQTNGWFATVNVGHTVRLKHDRVGFVRYKGKVKFGIGIWYGLELYDTVTKTRHNGTICGKRYFNCPRYKGLFVKRDIIIVTIPQKDIKKVLKKLERKQIKEKKRLSMMINITDDNNNNNVVPVPVKKVTTTTNNAHLKTSSILDLYNNAKNKNNPLNIHNLNLKINNNLLQQTYNDKEEEKQIKNEFKRYNRLSIMAINNADLQTIINKDIDDIITEHKQQNVVVVDTNADEFDTDEKPMCVPVSADDVTFEYNVKLYYDIGDYLIRYEYVIDKGLLIQDMNCDSKQGRALILEYGIQTNHNWYIISINDKEIKSMSKDECTLWIQNIDVSQGYTVRFQKKS